MKGLSVRSTANTVLDRLATALAAYATVEQTQTDTKWEPNDRGKQTCQCQTATATKSVQELVLKCKAKKKRTDEPVSRFGDMLSGLETDHLWVIWR